MTKSSIVALAKGKKHGITKLAADTISLLAGLGVEGDAHCGERVKHRSRARYNPGLPNLRQVHLISAELYDELRDRGFSLAPGGLGENITVCGADLLSLNTGTKMSFPSGAEIELTGLRNPCKQLEGIAEGLMEALIERSADGAIIRKGGVMAVVTRGGEVRCGEQATIHVVPGPPLKPV